MIQNGPTISPELQSKILSFVPENTSILIAASPDSLDFVHFYNDAPLADVTSIFGEVMGVSIDSPLGFDLTQLVGKASVMSRREIGQAAVRLFSGRAYGGRVVLTPIWL